MAWDEGQTMQARFEHAAQWGSQLHGHWQLGDTYSGFTAALIKQSPPTIEGLVHRFQRHMRAMAPADWRVAVAGKLLRWMAHAWKRLIRPLMSRV